MRLRLIVCLTAIASVAACGKKPSEPPPPPAPAAAASPAPATASAPAAAAAASSAPASDAAETSLTSYAAGAWLHKKPPEYSEQWSAFRLLDERADTGWASPKGNTEAQQVIIALPEKTLLRTLDFDTASIDDDTSAAKDVLVEMSDTDPDTGYAPIASVSLAAKADRQRFPVSKQVPGRWLRLTLKNNHGSANYIELMDFRGYGEQLTKSVVPDVSGTYDTNYGAFHLQQQGGKVSGCYEHRQGLIESGGMDGRVMRFTWTEDKGDPQRVQGPAVLGFSPDGKQLLGLWWSADAPNDAGSYWVGKKTSDKVGTCPHWKGAQQSGLETALGAGERVKLYGISFDTDSARIRDESKASLDEVISMAKNKPDWRFTIEGHTDATASAAHNQVLSEQRANAVKAYLTTAGLAADRFAVLGLGATKPVADNTTGLGRSRNRRVELIKQ